MESQLYISSKLKEEIKESPELEKAIYFAYNKKKDYGQCVFELPVRDTDSFMSEILDGENSVFHSLDFTGSDESCELADLFRNKSKGVRAGSILKLKP